MKPSASAPRPVFHLVANSHLDPVWLWDRREGLNEALSTVRTVLDLMREKPELRYIRGETLVYEQVLQHAPRDFAEIRRLVRSGRWDPVGGTYLQPDMNLPAAETLARHFTTGQEFFLRHFGRRAWAGWSADCFGHTPFLPAILRAHGLRAYAFGRPKIAGQESLFWWESPDGARVLATTYAAGWYGCERDEMPARLDGYLAAVVRSPVPHLFVPFGLGNHGGGPTRRHLADIVAWQRAHPEIEVRFSTLHGYFSAIEAALAETGVRLPVVRGDLGFCLRGTYATALRVKSAYRRAEAAVIRDSKLVTMLPRSQRRSFATRLEGLWRGVMFNSFHDILPGTCIEAAMEEQREELGAVLHGCRELEREATLALGRKIRVKSRPVPSDHPTAARFLVVNPQPRAFRGMMELAGMLDYRPVWAYANHPEKVPLELRDQRGRLCAFQELEPGHHFMRHLPWRKRVVFAAQLPPRSSRVFTLGWVEGALRIPLRGARAEAAGKGTIRNDRLRITAKRGAAGLRITTPNGPLLSGDGLSALLVEDPYGPWGGHYEEPASLELLKVREHWKVVDHHILEEGPLRAALWCRLAGRRSHLDLIVRLGRSDTFLVAEARLLFLEKRARLKLRLPGCTQADFSVPGGVVRRGPQGEVPGGRWLRALGAHGRARFIFASDVLYNFSLSQGALHATVVRSSRYTMDVPEKDARLSPGEPVIDRGEFKFRFLIGTPGRSSQEAAELFEEPPLVATLPSLEERASPRKRRIPER